MPRDTDALTLCDPAFARGSSSLKVTVGTVKKSMAATVADDCEQRPASAGRVLDFWALASSSERCFAPTQRSPARADRHWPPAALVKSSGHAQLLIEKPASQVVPIPTPHRAPH